MVQPTGACILAGGSRVFWGVPGNLLSLDCGLATTLAYLGIRGCHLAYGYVLEAAGVPIGICAARGVDDRHLARW